MNSIKTPWWKGRRGEWYVVLQFVFFFLLVFGPRSFSESQGDFYINNRFIMITGIILIAVGGVMSFSGVIKLGRNLTPVPHPKDNSILVETGPYSLVRHPIYSGLIFMSFGWAFFVQSWFTVIYAVILFIFFDIKSRREEKFLQNKFSNYQSYMKHVRKLIPYIY